MNDETLTLDAWLRHTVETINLYASCQKGHNEPLRQVMDGWAKEIEIAAAEIERHNKDVLSRCDDKKSCGYEKYSIHCSSCPIEWFLTWPEKTSA